VTKKFTVLREMLRAGPGLRPVTHREDAHADWGLQQARHLEPSHPAAAGAGAGAGTFDSRLLGQQQEPLKKVKQVNQSRPRSGRRSSIGGAGQRPSKRQRRQMPATNRPLGNSSYSRLGSEVGTGSGFRMRKALPAPPAARGGRGLGAGPRSGAASCPD
jgi:hypothetical protein